LLLEAAYLQDLRPAAKRSARVLATVSVQNYVAANGPFRNSDGVKLDLLNQQYPYEVLKNELEPSPTALAKIGTTLVSHMHLHSKWQDIVLSDPANPTNVNNTSDT